MKDIIVDDNKEETIDNIINEFNLYNTSIKTTNDDKVFITGSSKDKYLVRVSIEPLYMEETSSGLHLFNDHHFIYTINNSKKETIKECIRLHNQGYTQTDIADKLNISQGTVSNYLHKYVLVEDKKKEDNN